MRPNGFVRLRKLFENGRPVLEIEELTQSEKLTAGRHRETEMALGEASRGVGPTHDKSAVGNTAVELEEVRERNRERHRSLER